MPYIGNPIYQSAFVTDQFSGNGSTTAFTMSVAPAGVTNVLVAVSGVLQDPSTYGVSGNTLTFSTAPPSGTGNISCRYLGIPVTGVVTTAYRTVTEFTATASQTTFTPPSYTVGYINVYRNGVRLGSADYTATNGTTVVLTSGATAGDLVTVESFRVESVLNAIPNAPSSISASNLVAGTTLNTVATNTTGTYNAQILVVAGGGAGGGGNFGGNGGGGAGGLLMYDCIALTPSTAYTATVGAGGAGVATTGNSGSNSSFTGLTTAVGGGGGGGQGSTTGSSGGSGGGSAEGGAYGAGTAGQGFRGGSNYYSYNGGGGGGSGGVGLCTAGVSASPFYNQFGGNGGIGTFLTISGTGVWYAGGGGGSSYGGATTGTFYNQGGAGGAGGGGNGVGSQPVSALTATSGTANTGGGGGAGSTYSYNGTGSNGTSGSGGSGVIVVRYFGAQRGTGGTVTSVGGYTIHTFTTSGTYTA